MLGSASEHALLQQMLHLAADGVAYLLDSGSGVDALDTAGLGIAEG